MKGINSNLRACKRALRHRRAVRGSEERSEPHSDGTSASKQCRRFEAAAVSPGGHVDKAAISGAATSRTRALMRASET